MSIPENATSDERIRQYLEEDDYLRARTLAGLVDYLHLCFHWDIKLTKDDEG